MPSHIFPLISALAVGAACIAGNSPPARAMQICNDADSAIWMALVRPYERGTGTSTEAEPQMLPPNYSLHAWYRISPGECIDAPDATWIHARGGDIRTGRIPGNERAVCLDGGKTYGTSRRWDDRCRDGEEATMLVPIPLPGSGQVLKVFRHPQNFLALAVSYDERSRNFNFAEAAAHLDWCVRHEGVPIFDETVPGNLRDAAAIRNECLAKQGHSASAQLQLRTIGDRSLLSVLSQISERSQNAALIENFKWVAYHEGRAADFRRYLAEGRYDMIRYVFHKEQDHNPDVKNTLAGVSNGYIRWLIQTYL